MGSSSLPNLSYLLQMLKLIIIIIIIIMAIIIKVFLNFGRFLLYLSKNLFGGEIKNILTGTKNSFPIPRYFGCLNLKEKIKNTWVLGRKYFFGLSFLTKPISSFLKETHFWGFVLYPKQMNFFYLCQLQCRLFFSQGEGKADVGYLEFSFPAWKRKRKYLTFPPIVKAVKIVFRILQSQQINICLIVQKMWGLRYKIKLLKSNVNCKHLEVGEREICWSTKLVSVFSSGKGGALLTSWWKEATLWSAPIKIWTKN